MNTIPRRLVSLTLALLAALLARAAAPPLPRPARLDARQQRRINALHEQIGRAAAAGQFDDAEKLARQVAALREKCQGRQHWQTIDARLDVEVWQHLARCAVKDKRAVVRAQRLREQGLELRGRGDAVQAEQKLRQALHLFRTALGDEALPVAAVYNDLASGLHAQGKFAQAIPLYEKAVQITRQVQGAEHPQTATLCNSLAVCLQEQGRHAEAQRLFEKARAICTKSLGQRHPNTARSYGSLAYCLQAQGQYTQARAGHEKALAILRDALGEEHPDIATSCNNLAMCLQGLGKHPEALVLLHRALAIKRRLLGEAHPSTANSYNNLATCLYDQGKPAQAQVLFEKALAIHRQVLGEEHPAIARTCYNLASCLQAQGKHAQAQPLHEKALIIWRGVLGEEHPSTLGSYNNLASCLNDQGRHAAALSLYRQVLAIERRMLPPEHPRLADTWNNLAYCLVGLGRHAEALPLYEKALAICRKARGEEHPLTAVCCNNLADCLNRLGKQTQAQRLYEKALAIECKALGKEHPTTAATCNNLAACLAAQGKHQGALPLYRQALAIYSQRLGEEHPYTAGSCNNLAFCLEDLGRLPEAMLLLQSLLPGQEAARLHGGQAGFDRALAARQASPHIMLALGLAQLGQPLNAYRHAEAGLARGLLDDLARGQRGDTARIEALSARLRALDRQLLAQLGRHALSPDQKQRHAELARQRRAVTAELSRLAVAASARQVVSLQEIQSALPADAALVLWFDPASNGRYPGWACVVRRQGPPAWVPLPGSGKAGAWTADDLSLEARLYRALTDPTTTPAECDRLLAGVRRLRLGPLAGQLQARGELPRGARLLVVPVGGLAALPVEALAPEYTVSVVPSGSVLAHLSRRRRPLSGESLLAVGAPNFTPSGTKAPEPPARGLLLSAVLPGSAAAKAGLQAGDVLLSFGTQPVESLDDLKRALAAGPGRMRYWREGKIQRTPLLPAGALGVSIDPSPPAQALKRWRERHRSVVQRGTVHRPLPGTAHEVRALAALVQNTTLLTGSAASEQELDRLLQQKRLKSYRLLHLATHGEIDPRSPDRSRLILAQDNLPDPLRLQPGQKHYTGALTVRDIRDSWQLDADLVVLSACQTALGKPARGEGLLGFAHAFLARGARSVVLSRWKVDDSATALLMVRFYENLLGKRAGLKKALGRADALAEAKQWLAGLKRREAEALAVRLAGGVLRGTEAEALPVVKGKPAKLPAGDRPFAHPYYWAAFVLVGDPE